MSYMHSIQFSFWAALQMDTDIVTILEMEKLRLRELK